MDEDKEKKVKIVQFENSDYPTYFQLGYSGKKMVERTIKFLNPLLQKEKITLEDIKNYHRVIIYNLLKNFSRRHGTSYLVYIHNIFKQIMDDKNKVLFENDIKRLRKEYRRIRKKKDYLTPEEVINYLKQSQKQPKDLIIKFGISFQSLLGIRYSSLKYSSFEFTIGDLYQIINQRNRFWIQMFGGAYEKIKEIILQTMDQKEMRIFQNSKLVQGDKFVFYWKGNRYEKFSTNEYLLNLAEKIRRVRIKQIFYLTKRFAERDIGIKEERTKRLILLYKRWFLPYYFPYSSYTYWKSLREIFHKEISYHDLRRTFATELYEKGLDLFTIKNAMRHMDIKTTQLYIQDKETSKKIDEIFSPLFKSLANRGDKNENK